MDMDDQDCQSCPAKSAGAQVEEGVVHSRVEGTDFAAAGNFEQAEKGAVTRAIDMGTPLGCIDRKKALHPWSLDVADCYPACAAQTPDMKPQRQVTLWMHCHYRRLKLASSRMVMI